MLPPLANWSQAAAGLSSLEVHLLGVVEFASLLAVQEVLVEELAARTDHRGILLVCEHTPTLTIGREGSRGRPSRRARRVRRSANAAPVARSWRRHTGSHRWSVGRLSAGPRRPVGVEPRSLSVASDPGFGRDVARPRCRGTFTRNVPWRSRPLRPVCLDCCGPPRWNFPSRPVCECFPANSNRTPGALAHGRRAGFLTGGASPKAHPYVFRSRKPRPKPGSVARIRELHFDYGAPPAPTDPKESLCLP